MKIKSAKPEIQTCKPLSGGVLMGLWLTIGATLALGASAPTAPVTPKELNVPEGNRYLMKVLAVGVQIYTCSAKPDASGFEWTFKAPEAILNDADGKKIGTHYAGPSWEAIDGSKVQGVVKARFASSDPQAIPWLLLATRSTGKDGMLAKVTFIQRLETVGGKAPADGCTQAKLNQELRVNYSADYHLYTGKD
jgi:Protein of unknown function (DUF3455)